MINSRLSPIDVDVCISYSISKNTVIPIKNYNIEEWEDSEINDDGFITKTGGIDYDFSDTIFEEEFNNSKELGIPELLNILKMYVKADIEGSFHTENDYAANILKACEDWNVDELVVVKE